MVLPSGDAMDLVWLAGEVWDDLKTVTHELGHTAGLKVGCEV
jgi:hypothetical protein